MAGAAPTPRAAATAMADEEQRLLLDLPAELLQKIVYYLTLAHEIAGMAPTCRQLCAAAKLVFKARPFTLDVMTLDHKMDHRGGAVGCVAVTPDGQGLITGTQRGSICM